MPPSNAPEVHHMHNETHEVAITAIGLADAAVGLRTNDIPVRTYSIDSDRGANTRYGIFPDDMAKAGLHACVIDGKLDSDGILAALVMGMQALSAKVDALTTAKPPVSVFDSDETDVTYAAPSAGLPAVTMNADGTFARASGSVPLAPPVADRMPKEESSAVDPETQGDAVVVQEEPKAVPSKRVRVRKAK